MISQDRLTSALHHVADGVTAPEVDLSAVRTQARSKRVRAASVTALTAAVAVIVASTTLLGGRDTSAPQPASSPLPSTARSTASPDTYASSQYAFTIVHPPGWNTDAADRAWSWEVDARDWRSPAHETFFSADHDIRVSAWSVPINPGTPAESATDLEAWVEDYCHRSGNSPCTGITDRAVELCQEQWNCTSGVLVPFKEDVQAFFRGGRYDSEAMTIVAVWRPESDPSPAPYGGSRKLLERFLAPMGIRPNTHTDAAG